VSDKYTVERFLSACSKQTVKTLRAAWKEGDQLAADKVPKDALPAVLILAAWGRRCDMELVDDYDVLLKRTRAAMTDGSVNHPDLFFASGILIMHERGEDAVIGGFVQLNIDGIFNDLLGLGDES
jgi:hypothetical protein